MVVLRAVDERTEGETRGSADRQAAWAGLLTPFASTFVERRTGCALAGDAELQFSGVTPFGDDQTPAAAVSTAVGRAIGAMLTASVVYGEAGDPRQTDAMALDAARAASGAAPAVIVRAALERFTVVRCRSGWAAAGGFNAVAEDRLPPVLDVKASIDVWVIADGRVVRHRDGILASGAVLLHRDRVLRDLGAAAAVEVAHAVLDGLQGSGAAGGGSSALAPG